MNKYHQYFNLNYYELRDLKDLMRYHKKFDGIHQVKLNVLDRLISKEHKYGYNRMSIFMIWLLGGCLPFWILFGVILNNFINNIDVSYGISCLICLLIGGVLQLVYELSCDKLDYNALLDKNGQINIYEWLDSLSNLKRVNKI